MVADTLTDGVRIAQLLASEVTGHAGPLAGLAVVDADRTVDPTADGALAYRVVDEGVASGEADAGPGLVAVVAVQPDRAYVEFVREPAVAAAAAGDRGLRTRPKAVRPPRTLVFVESGAEVKDALAVFRAVRDAGRRGADDPSGTGDPGDAP